MVDIKKIRENPKEVEEGIRKKGYEFDVEFFLALDEKRRKLQKELDDKKHKKNILSRIIGEKKSKNEDAVEELKKTKELSKDIKKLDDELKSIEKEIKRLHLLIPNLPHPSLPSEDTVVKEWGEKRNFNFSILNHIELCEATGIANFKRAAKISGTRFGLFEKEGAALERALINFCLDLHTKEHGYIEVFPPVLAREGNFVNAGQLPHLAEDMYKMQKDPLWLIPTAETVLVNLHAGEVLREEELPKKYVAYTPCFRREAGSYGKEVKGLFRVHQFDKVELVQYTLPSQSYKALEEMLSHAERVLQLLKLPYRVRLLSPKEIAFQSAKTYDIEVWAPGMEEWLEVSSVSNCEDFQARRSKTRVRLSTGELIYPHILNGSGVAFARTFIAIVENYQNKDGSITIPEVLRSYMGGKEKIG